MEPKFLFLDEPAAGLNEEESDALHDLLKNIPTRYHVGLIVVEHDMRLMMNLCPRLHVLNYGTHDRRGYACRGSRQPRGRHRLPREQCLMADADGREPRRVVRRGARAPRYLARGQRGRTGRAPRRERRGQVHDAEVHHAACCAR